MAFKTVVLDGEIALTTHLDGDMELVTHLDGEVGIITEVIRADYPFYTGATSVNPSFDSVVLETSETIVMDDITVNPIQVESVSNPQGGRTVFIGGII